MSVDFVKVLSRQMSAYARQRGGTAPTGLINRTTGRPLILPHQLVPSTTWGDVWAVYNHLLRYADPSETQCREIVLERLREDPSYRSRLPGDIQSRAYKAPDDYLAMLVCADKRADVSPRAFARTSQFQKALADFRAADPANKLGGGIVGATQLLLKVPTGEVYPHNEEFWGYANALALERSAAGVVPLWNELLAESVNESIEELPETIKSAAGATLGKIRDAAGALLPDVSPWVDLLKWGSIAGGVLILWWYVIRPEFQRERE